MEGGFGRQKRGGAANRVSVAGEFWPHLFSSLKIQNCPKHLQPLFIPPPLLPGLWTFCEAKIFSQSKSLPVCFYVYVLYIFNCNPNAKSLLHDIVFFNVNDFYMLIFGKYTTYIHKCFSICYMTNIKFDMSHHRLDIIGVSHSALNLISI